MLKRYNGILFYLIRTADQGPRDNKEHDGEQTRFTWLEMCEPMQFGSKKRNDSQVPCQDDIQKVLPSLELETKKEHNTSLGQFLECRKMMRNLVIERAYQTDLVLLRHIHHSLPSVGKMGRATSER